MISCISAGPPLYRGELTDVTRQGEGVSIDEPGARRPALHRLYHPSWKKKAFLEIYQKSLLFLFWKKKVTSVRIKAKPAVIGEGLANEVFSLFCNFYGGCYEFTQ